MIDYKPIVGMCLMEALEKGDQGIITVCNSSMPSHVMLVEYQKLKVKLEDLPEEEKKELWQFANNNFPHKTKEEKINVCKIIHTVGMLI